MEPVEEAAGEGFIESNPVIDDPSESGHVKLPARIGEHDRLASSIGASCSTSKIGGGTLLA